MIVVNTETIPGYQITEVQGIVQGNTVRSKHMGRDIAASFKNLVGGELTGYTELLTEARREALENALSAARKDAKAQKGRADAAETALKKLQAQAKPEAKGNTERLTAENERLRKFLRELKARLASANEEKTKAVEAAEAKGVARGIEKGKSELDEAVKEAEARGKAQGLDEGRAEAEAVDDVDEKVQEEKLAAAVTAKEEAVARSGTTAAL